MNHSAFPEKYFVVLEIDMTEVLLIERKILWILTQNLLLFFCINSILLKIRMKDMIIQKTLRSKRYTFW